MNHDIIAVGASAGGVEVLLDMAGGLPADLPASVFVAIHSTPTYSSMLPDLMTKRGQLVASHPIHGEKIKPGHIYVAPPDTQLYLRQGSMEIVRGPKENGHRPSVDALFRTASMVYGPRVVGVVLSGYLDCGTAGMMSIKARGGVSVVQDPTSASAPDMPRNVMERVKVDHIVTPDKLPKLLANLAMMPAGKALEPNGIVAQLEGAEPGEPTTDLVCPICQGVLTEAKSTSLEHFRCHVGHAFTLQSLVQEQSEELERALWAAVRSLEESAALSRRLQAYGSAAIRERFAEKARTQTAQAQLIRQLLLHGHTLTPEDSKKVPGG